MLKMRYAIWTHIEDKQKYGANERKKANLWKYSDTFPPTDGSMSKQAFVGKGDLCILGCKHL